MEWLENNLQAVLMNPAVFAFVFGIASQVFGTQKLKFLLPINWSDDKRRRVILAMSLGLTVPAWPIYFVGQWIANGLSWAPIWHGLWLWLFVWLTGTAIYEAWVKTRPREQQKALSAKHDAEKKRQKVVKNILTGRRLLRDAEDRSGPNEETEFYIGESTVVLDDADSETTEPLTKPPKKGEETP